MFNHEIGGSLEPPFFCSEEWRRRQQQFGVEIVGISAPQWGKASRIV